MKFCLPSIVNENKLSSLLFKAGFASKLLLLKRNSFVLNTLDKVNNWLNENINRIYRKGGKAYLENHFKNQKHNNINISDYNEKY